MVINSQMVWEGTLYKLRYEDMDSFEGLPREKCRQVYGVCFYKDKMVVGWGGKKEDWGLIGGTVEEGETFEETLIREIVEEANMKVIKEAPIGTQEVFYPGGSSIHQLRFVAIVEPIGKFEKDPDGSVKKIKLINPKDYKKYFDWGKIGERIIERALQLKETMQI